MYDTDYLADNTAAEEASAAADGDTAEGDGAAAVTQNDTHAQTKAFSERLNKMSDAKVDEFVKSLNITNPYTGNKVTTRREHEEYLQMVAADNAGADPETTAENFRLRSQLADYQLREEESRLKTDPVFGSYFEQYRDELLEAQRDERANGNDIPLEMLLRARIAEELPNILADRENKAKSEALTDIRANAAASPGSSGGAATGNSSSYASMSDADFEKVYRAALNGDLKKS